MKLSALIFRRCGYNFFVESTGFKWGFIYQQHELACQLSRITGKKLNSKEKSTQGRPRTAEAHPWEDVCVTIGVQARHVISSVNQ